MRPDFVERLRAAAEAMLATLDARTESRGARSGATTGLCTGISKARKHVRVLDAFVRHALQNDPALLTEWDTVKRPPAKTGKAGRRGPDVAEVATPNVEAPAAPEPALQLVAA